MVFKVVNRVVGVTTATRFAEYLLHAIDYDELRAMISIFAVREQAKESGITPEVLMQQILDEHAA